MLLLALTLALTTVVADVQVLPDSHASDYHSYIVTDVDMPRLREVGALPRVWSRTEEPVTQVAITSAAGQYYAHATTKREDADYLKSIFILDDTEGAPVSIR